VFSGYGFNKSHATAYAMIGYYCNWLKVHYPVIFWTVAFQWANDKKIPQFVTEIHKTGHIKIIPPNINISGAEFIPDYNNDTISWNLLQIKNISTTTLDAIIEERNSGGKFFTVEEFFTRVGKSKANKRVVTNLIVSGAFDIIYSIKQPKQRIKIIKEYFEARGEEIPIQFTTASTKHNYFWSIMQKQISGLGDVDFEHLAKEFSIFKDSSTPYYSPEVFSNEKSKGKTCIVAGWIGNDFIERLSKNGKFGIIPLNNNDETITVQCWSDTWIIPKKDEKNPFINLRDDIIGSEGRILVMKGKISRYKDTNYLNPIASEKGKSYEIF